MELSNKFYHYILLFFLFANGLWLSRLIAKFEIARSIVAFFARFGERSVRRMVFFIFLSSLFLSSFMPNVIAILTLLPVLKRIEEDNPLLDKKKLTTALGLSVIYGANIGGLLTIIGTPAHMILLANLEIFGIPFREKINFFSWFSFSIPLVFFLFWIGYGLIFFRYLRHLERTAKHIALPQIPYRHARPIRIQIAIFVAIVLATWFVLSMLEHLYWKSLPLIAVIGSLFGLLVIILPFVRKTNGPSPQPWLYWRDLFEDLPLRGFVFLGLMLAIGGMIAFFLKYYGWSKEIEKSMAKIFQMIAGHISLSAFLYLFLFALMTTFLTEFFSNTIVVLLFFAIFGLLSPYLDFDGIRGMITIHFASICSFMTPIATPVNAFAYGSLKNISLRWMISTGFLMNLLTATTLAIFFAHYPLWF